MEELYNQMKKYAIENNVPIIEDDGLEILLSIIEKNKPKTILELGTAIGYSALKMNGVCNSSITTIERDLKMYECAKANIKSADKTDVIKLNYCDALEFCIEDNTKFDMIYIDAAKAQYRKFFERYEKNLNKNGIVIFDNLKFHGLVDVENPKDIESKNVRQLVRKIKDFTAYIEQIDGYSFELIQQGDGIGVLRKNV